MHLLDNCFEYFLIWDKSHQEQGPTCRNCEHRNYDFQVHQLHLVDSLFLLKHYHEAGGLDLLPSSDFVV